MRASHQLPGLIFRAILMLLCGDVSPLFSTWVSLQSDRS
jgi:hypothetical protein